MEIITSYGPARAEIDQAETGQAATGQAGIHQAETGQEGRPAFLMVLTHGAGGGVDSPDLLAAREAGLELGGVVARVIQPYRLRGARAPGSPARQDAAWLEIIEALRARFAGIPLVQGGRSNGARLACRTASDAGARGVVALAFPLHPPGKPERSRAAELRGAGVDVLVVNGGRDPFGVPDSADAASVVVLAGEAHALSGNPGAVAQAVRSWLRGVLNPAAN